ncbi:MAG: hypothetical protein AB1440_00395 [Pseudomonadota bacterium]
MRPLGGGGSIPVAGFELGALSGWKTALNQESGYISCQIVKIHQMAGYHQKYQHREKRFYSCNGCIKNL